MDSFTDMDIFKDLQEACSKRHVKVYILLDQASFPHFLKMCSNLGVNIEEQKVGTVIIKKADKWLLVPLQLWHLKV